MSLIEHLQRIPNFCAARSQHDELWFVLLLIILGAMMDTRATALNGVRRNLWARTPLETQASIRHKTPFVLDLSPSDATVGLSHSRSSVYQLSTDTAWSRRG